MALYELRTYHATPGKLDALQDRFRNHTLGLFKKHGLTVVAFWTPVDTPDILVYLLRFDDQAAADRAWAAFLGDPEWNDVKAASEVDGPLTSGIERVFLNPTDYSPLP